MCSTLVEEVVKEEIKTKVSAYIIGGIVGAIAVLIAGFWVGPLTTNGAAADAVNAAVIEQQAFFCAERGRADPAYVDGATFKSLAFSEKRDFAARFAKIDGEVANERAVANACRTLLEQA